MTSPECMEVSDDASYLFAFKFVITHLAFLVVVVIVQTMGETAEMEKLRQQRLHGEYMYLLVG